MDKIDTIINIKKKPWHKYNLNRSLPPPRVGDVVDKIKSLTFNNHEFAAALSVLYLYASRKREVLPYRYKGSYKDEIYQRGLKIEKPALQLKNIWLQRDELPDLDDNYSILLWMRIRNEKIGASRLGPDKMPIDRRERLLKLTHFKEIPVPTDDDDIEYPLIEIIWNWFEVNDWLKDDVTTLVNNLQPGESLWPFKQGLEEVEVVSESYNKLDRVVKKFGWSIHNMRDWRLRHCREKGMDIQTLTLLGGWSKGSSMPLIYSKSDITAFKRFFRENK